MSLWSFLLTWSKNYDLFLFDCIATLCLMHNWQYCYVTLTWFLCYCYDLITQITLQFPINVNCVKVKKGKVHTNLLHTPPPEQSSKTAAIGYLTFYQPSNLSIFRIFRSANSKPSWYHTVKHKVSERQPANMIAKYYFIIKCNIKSQNH